MTADDFSQVLQGLDREALSRLLAVVRAVANARDHDQAEGVLLASRAELLVLEGWNDAGGDQDQGGEGKCARPQN